MKKKKRKIIVVILLAVVLAVVAFMNCKVDMTKLIKDNLSEIRSELYVGESSHYRAYIASGYREEPYKCDGIKNELVEFGVITLRAKQGNLNSASYHLTIGDKEYTGQFEYDPYGSALVVDVEKFITGEGDITLTVTVNGDSEEVNMVNKSKDFKIKTDDVVNLIAKEYENKLSELVSLKTLQGEIYIKIATDNDFTFDTTYYYVSICDRNGNCTNFLVDVNSGNIVATKS